MLCWRFWIAAMYRAVPLLCKGFYTKHPLKMQPLFTCTWMHRWHSTTHTHTYHYPSQITLTYHTYEMIFYIRAGHDSVHASSMHTSSVHACACIMHSGGVHLLLLQKWPQLCKVADQDVAFVMVATSPSLRSR
jgi:hypothetical protein